MTAREFEVSLPVGLDGERRAAIRKMRGHEEALLHDATLPAGRLVTELLKGCLVRLGNDATIDRDLVSRLYTADRNYLVVELRRITLGDELRCAYSCAGCGGEVAVVEDLGRLPVRRLEDGASPDRIELELEDGYRDMNGVVHTSMQLRLPRGADEEFVASTAEKDPLRARDALLLRCIESFGTLTRAALEGYGIKILRDLTLGDLRMLYRAIELGSPGIDFRRSVRCPGCGARFETLLETSSFFVLG
jgi:hypothetical protein